MVYINHTRIPEASRSAGGRDGNPAGYPPRPPPPRAPGPEKACLAPSRKTLSAQRGTGAAIVQFSATGEYFSSHVGGKANATTQQ